MESGLVALEEPGKVFEVSVSVGGVLFPSR